VKPKRLQKRLRYWLRVDLGMLRHFQNKGPIGWGKQAAIARAEGLSTIGWQRGLSLPARRRFEAERRKQETSKRESGGLRLDVLTFLAAEADERGDSKMAASLRDVAESLAASERAKCEADS